MTLVMYHGWRIRTVSVVEGSGFSAAALLEKEDAAWSERRRFAFAGISCHDSAEDAEFQATCWAKRWIESRERVEPTLCDAD